MKRGVATDLLIQTRRIFVKFLCVLQSSLFSPRINMEANERDTARTAEYPEKEGGEYRAGLDETNVGTLMHLELIFLARLY